MDNSYEDPNLWIGDPTKVGDVKRKTPQRPAGTDTDGAVLEPQEAGEHRAVGRRALLTGGGAVAAGAVGAGMAMVAAATPASAAVGDPVNQGVSNDAGTNVAATEITAANNSAPTPTLIVTNTGSPASGQASPALRITPAVSGLDSPAANTVGGDMVATNDGNLWFTHAIPGSGNVPAVVHTDANSNSFAPLVTPYRILDTRTSAGRAHVLDPSGKFDSAGRLIANQIIHIDLSLLVEYGDALTANLTVTGSTHSGFLTLWPGDTARPIASSVNYAEDQTIANLTTSGIAAYSSTKTDTIAIYCSAGNTQVILDVVGFYVSDFAQVNSNYAGITANSVRRAQRISQAHALS
jgi:hypothetical protein